MPNFETMAKGNSNPGSLDCESGVLPLSYRAMSMGFGIIIEGSPSIPVIVHFLSFSAVEPGSIFLSLFTLYLISISVFRFSFTISMFPSAVCVTLCSRLFPFADVSSPQSLTLPPILLPFQVTHHSHCAKLFFSRGFGPTRVYGLGSRMPLAPSLLIHRCQNSLKNAGRSPLFLGLSSTFTTSTNFAITNNMNDADADVDHHACATTN